MNGFKRQFVFTIFILAFSITLFADDFMNWTGNFTAIDLGHLSTRGAVLSGSSSSVILTNGDCEIGADNSSAACLSFNGNQLDTQYKLVFDGDGGSATGGSQVDYTPYDTFLTSRAEIRHILTDDNVTVTLWVKVTSPAHNVPDAGTYNATQTLTVYWTGP
jgi:hypothetical protein